MVCFLWGPTHPCSSQSNWAKPAGAMPAAFPRHFWTCPTGAAHESTGGTQGVHKDAWHGRVRLQCTLRPRTQRFLHRVSRKERRAEAKARETSAGMSGSPCSPPPACVMRCVAPPYSSAKAAVHQLLGWPGVQPAWPSV